MPLPFNPDWKYANVLSTNFPVTMPLPGNNGDLIVGQIMVMGAWGPTGNPWNPRISSSLVTPTQSQSVVDGSTNRYGIGLSTFSQTFGTPNLLKSTASITWDFVTDGTPVDHVWGVAIILAAIPLGSLGLAFSGENYGSLTTVGTNPLSVSLFNGADHGTQFDAVMGMSTRNSTSHDHSPNYVSGSTAARFESSTVERLGSSGGGFTWVGAAARTGALRMHLFDRPAGGFRTYSMTGGTTSGTLLTRVRYRTAELFYTEPLPPDPPDPSPGDFLWGLAPFDGDYVFRFRLPEPPPAAGDEWIVGYLTWPEESAP
jgi:hypothetical protein